MVHTPVRRLADDYQDRLYAAGQYSNGMAYTPGRQAQNTLGAASGTGAVVADETVTIGTNVFQFKALTTDSTKTASLNNSEDISLLTASGAMTWNLGDLLRLDSEIVKILRFVVGAETTQAIVARHRSGTAVAAHVTAAIFQASAVHATNIPVGLNATLTPAVWTVALAAEINNAKAGSERATAKASTIFDPGSTVTDAFRSNKVIATAGPSSDCVVIYSVLPEACVLATTETMTNAAWGAGATMADGAAPSLVRRIVFRRVPSAADVSLGKLMFKVPFTPRHYSAQVLITSSGIAKGWVGGVSFDSTTGLVTVDNAGATDWAATDTVVLTVEE